LSSDKIKVINEQTIVSSMSTLCNETIKIKEEHSFKTLFYLIQLVLTLPRLLNLLKNYSVKGSVSSLLIVISNEIVEESCDQQVNGVFCMTQPGRKQKFNSAQNPVRKFLNT
jgi:hypothetical protein